MMFLCRQIKQPPNWVLLMSFFLFFLNCCGLKTLKAHSAAVFHSVATNLPQGDMSCAKAQPRAHDSRPKKCCPQKPWCSDIQIARDIKKDFSDFVQSVGRHDLSQQADISWQNLRIESGGHWYGTGPPQGIITRPFFLSLSLHPPHAPPSFLS